MEYSSALARSALHTSQSRHAEPKLDSLLLVLVQAQGLVHLMGGVGFVHQAVRAHSVVLAAHGPYTAAGAASVLGVPVSDSPALAVVE